uniref:Uncharacterized protein n=1 Tax=Magallana gigas TaxID=29159 RepID=A0A8W8M4S3_MAGGI
MENTVKFCIVFLILFQPVVPIDSKFCNRINGRLECCTGYKLNPERTNCIPCDRGFLGENCVTKCPYPTYGDSCQSECYCNVTYCDHVSGCTETSEEVFRRQNLCARRFWKRKKESKASLRENHVKHYRKYLQPSGSAHRWKPTIDFDSSYEHGESFGKVDFWIAVLK